MLGGFVTNRANLSSVKHENSLILDWNLLHQLVNYSIYSKWKHQPNQEGYTDMLLPTSSRAAMAA